MSKVSGVIGGVQKTIATIEQQPLRPVSKVTFGNGVVRQYFYDTNDRLTGISSPSIQGLGLSYNNNNHITAINNSINTTLPQQQFSYDEVGRLAAVTSPGGNQSWTFDANGNRETHFWEGATDDYHPETHSNRIPSITGNRAKNYTFNSLGNITAKSGYGGNQNYSYDAFDRINNLTNGNEVTQYANNGLNQRVRKTGPRGNFSYLYGPGGTLLGETSHNGTAITTQYIWLGGELLGVVRNNLLFFVHTDQLSRPEVVTDESQSIVWRASNFAYDRNVTTNNFGGLNVGFPGQYFDMESDLWYNGHRYYDASTGRYVQSDPIGLGGGRNSYPYVEGNPINHIDYLGLFKICQRPLSFAGNYMSSGITGSDLGIFYEQGFYENELGGNTGFTSNGLFDDSKNEGKYQRCNEKQYNDNIMRQVEINISQNWRHDYSFLTNNYQYILIP